MKKVFLSCLLAASVSGVSCAEDKTKLTPDEIQSLIDLARLVEIEKEYKLRHGIDEFGTMQIINPDIHWNSDSDIYCPGAITLPGRLTETSERKSGQQAAPSELPDNCSIRHKTVARLKTQEMQDVPIVLRETGPVDEPSLPE